MQTEERISRPLTDRQREVLELIRRRVLETQLPPTVREIGEHFDIRSTNGVRAILAALEKKGYLKRSPKLSRGLSVLPDAVAGDGAEARQDRSASNLPASDLAFGQDFVEIPVLGRVAAGSPILAVQNLEGTVVVHRDFLAKQRDVFALKVIGDSMKDAGILDGDLVFARQQATARSGEIVVAMVGEDATVKTFIPEGRRVRLQPANESYSPIYVDSTSPDLRIVGRVIGVLRKYAF